MTWSLLGASTVPLSALKKNAESNRSNQGHHQGHHQARAHARRAMRFTRARRSRGDRWRRSLSLHGFRKRNAGGTPWRTRDASEVGKACDAGRVMASEAGPTGAIAVAEAIAGAIAAREPVSTDLAIVFHCANTVSMQWTSLQALRVCRHWASCPGESLPLFRRACCCAEISSYSLFRMAWSHITRSAGWRVVAH